MFCRETDGAGQYGSVPLAVTLLLTALIAVIAAMPMYLLPSQGGPMGWMLPGFAAFLTLGVLRAKVPTQFHPVWALVGFPMMIGLTLFTFSVLRASSPSSGGSSGAGSFVWMFPVLFLGRGNRRSGCEKSCSGTRMAWIALGCIFAIPATIAGWLVWDAVKSGKGSVYTELPSILEFSGIWTGAIMLVGAAMVSTMGLRQRPTSGTVDSTAVVRRY